MTDRPTSNRDDATDDDQPDEGSTSHDYQAPTLYESSSLLSKYASPSSEDASEPAAPDLAEGSASIADALASSAVNLTSSASAEVLSSRTPDLDAGSDAGDEFTLSFDDADESSGTEALLAVASEHGLTDASAAASIESESASWTDTGHDDHDEEDEEDASIGDARRDVDDTDETDDATEVDQEHETDGWAALATTAAPRDADFLHNQQQKRARGWQPPTPPTLPTPPAEPDSSVDATQRPSAGKKSHQLIYWGIAAVITAAFDVGWFAWPLTIGVAIASGFAVAGKWGKKWIGYVGFLLVVIALVISGISIAGGLSFDGDSGGSDNEVLNVDGSPTIEGSGNATLDVVLPEGPLAFAAIDVTLTTDDSIRIRELDSSGDTVNYSSHSLYREGSKQFPINIARDSAVATLEVESEGEWSITLLSLDQLTSFDEHFEGTPDDQLVVYTGTGGDAVFTFAVEDSVSVEGFPSDGGRWSNQSDGASSITIPWGAGPVLILVESYEPWSITMQPTSTDTETGPGATEEPTEGADPAGVGDPGGEADPGENTDEDV